MRKCRNWQTSKTKDLVLIASVWVQVPSSALEKEKRKPHLSCWFPLFLYFENRDVGGEEQYGVSIKNRKAYDTAIQ